MRAALFLAPLFFAACTTPEPPPAPVEPPPVPDPVKIEKPAEPAVADCVDLTFTDGTEGTYTVIADADSHGKQHFTMPEGKDVLVLTATWPDAAWEMEVAAGVGGCPHSGTTHATVTANGAARVFLPASQLSAETTTFTTGETWFIHLNAKGEHAAGETVAYTMGGQACALVKPAAEPPPPVAGHAAPDHAPVVKVPPTSIKDKKAQGTGKAAKGKGK